MIACWRVETSHWKGWNEQIVVVCSTLTMFFRGGWNRPEQHNRRTFLFRKESCLCSRGSSLSRGTRLRAFAPGSHSAHSHTSSCAASEGAFSSVVVGKFHPSNSLAGREAPWSHPPRECWSLHSLRPCFSGSQSQVYYRSVDWEWMNDHEWTSGSRGHEQGHREKSTSWGWGPAQSTSAGAQPASVVPLTHPTPSGGTCNPLWPRLHAYLHCVPFLHFIPPHLISL